MIQAGAADDTDAMRGHEGVRKSINQPARESGALAVAAVLAVAALAVFLKFRGVGVTGIGLIQVHAHKLRA